MKEAFIVFGYVLITSFLMTMFEGLIKAEVRGSALSKIFYILAQQLIGAGIMYLVIKL